jgi:wyosine [tRNA(Phe)-imidazoG37] synthetase (radical SAM superfamily)
VWAKLDAGTPEFFRLVNRTMVPFEKILANIRACAQARAIVIQSCFFRLSGAGPSDAEIGAYVQRLRESRESGAQIRLVQVCTVARPPAYGVVSSLSDAEVDALAARVTREAGLRAEGFYGAIPEDQGLLGQAPRKLSEPG